MENHNKFVRLELIDFVEANFPFIDVYRALPATNGDTPAVPSGLATGASTESFPNTIYLFKKFIAQVAAFSDDAEHPDDVHARFRYGITAPHLVGGPTKEQLSAFDLEYSSLTRERKAAWDATQREAALVELRRARETVRQAEAQHDEHGTADTNSKVEAAKAEYEVKRSAALAANKCAADSGGERTSSHVSSPFPP